MRQLAWRTEADSKVAGLPVAAQPVERVEDAVNFYFPDLPRLPAPVRAMASFLLSRHVHSVREWLTDCACRR